MSALGTHVGANAQPTTKARRLAVISGAGDKQQGIQAGLSAFKAALSTLGWSEDRNLAIDVRWSGADVERARQHAKEVVASRPDVILTQTTFVTAAVHREASNIPVVFVIVSDPVGSGFVKSLAKPGGNITGFINIEASVIQKALELLKELYPRLSRAAVMFNPDTASYAEYYLQSLPPAASKLRVDVIKSPVRSDSDISTAIERFAREPNGGLLVMSDIFMSLHEITVLSEAARRRLPTTYFSANFVEHGGLSSYGVDSIDIWRRAASHVDRILRGAKPADLPVEQPSKFELAINLKTAKALGITVPPSLLLRADKVIE